jgi:DHA2 family multidrug resistance protein
VTGIAQLATAPLAVALDQRYDERALTALGFLIFGIGLGLSCVQTTTADYDEMFWPQVIRGCATMLCILPSTRLALGLIAKADVPDASGLFNMMRNLGGAIGIAIIDTLIHNRASIHSRDMIDRLTAGDIDLAKTLGVPLDVLAGLAFEPQKKDLVIAEFINKAALVEAINDSWAFLAISMLAAILVVPFARITSQSILIPEIRKGRVIVRRGRIDVRR